MELFTNFYVNVFEGGGGEGGDWGSGEIRGKTEILFMLNKSWEKSKTIA